MKSLYVVAALISASLSAQAVNTNPVCNVVTLEKEAMIYLNTKVNHPGTSVVGPCLSEAVLTSVGRDIAQGKDVRVTELYIEKVALEVKHQMDHSIEAAKMKAEIFEQQAQGIQFPNFLDDEADAKRLSPLEDVQD